jgi:hypothetical protein
MISHAHRLGKVRESPAFAGEFVAFSLDRTRPRWSFGSTDSSGRAYHTSGRLCAESIETAQTHFPTLWYIEGMSMAARV